MSTPRSSDRRHCVSRRATLSAHASALVSASRSVSGLFQALPCAFPARIFNVVFEDAGDGWVYAHVPELPEVQTQGESLDEARRMVREAIELVLEERQARGEPIPETGWALVEAVEIAA
jgi:antitoxin HicB